MGNKFDNKTLSIVIPVYNEEKTVSEIIRRIENADVNGVKKEIIIVDDSSTDGTKNIIKDLQRHENYKIIFHEKNKGKGAAVRTGIQAANGDVIIIQDADLEYDPNDYFKIIKPILDGSYMVVYGSRFLAKDIDFGTVPLHFLGNLSLNFITNILYGTKLTDMETCYKAFDARFLKQLKLSANRFEIDPELTTKVIKAGQKIFEVPISYSSRSFMEGKKITWKDGFKIFWYLLKHRVVN